MFAEFKLKKLKVMTVVGTRPEIIRLSRVIAKLDEHCDHILVHTGQNYDYELSEIFFQDLGIRKPDYFLNVAGATGSETIGKVIIETDQLLATVVPDCLLVLGDTNSCMSVIAAKKRKIPTFHMEAGNRCFDMRVPEEINRRIVDHTADLNFTYSDIAREYLLREGLPPDLIIKTGSPMFEVLYYYRDGIEKSDILTRLALCEGEFFVVSAHREENIMPEKKFAQLISMLNSIADSYNLPVIMSTHPRTKKQIEQHDIRLNSLIKLVKPLGYKDYNKLQMTAKVVLSDSGTITEESSILNFPALNIRETHERPEGMEESSVMMVGLETRRVLQGIELLVAQPRGEKRSIRLVEDYAMPNVSDKIVRLLYSYVDYINRNVWKRY